MTDADIERLAEAAFKSANPSGVWEELDGGWRLYWVTMTKAFLKEQVKLETERAIRIHAGQ